MTFCAIAVWVGVKLGVQHAGQGMHFDPSAQLDTSNVTLVHLPPIPLWAGAVEGVRWS